VSVLAQNGFCASPRWAVQIDVVGRGSYLHASAGCNTKRHKQGERGGEENGREERIKGSDPERERRKTEKINDGN
jgi:hypothetical protein